MREYVIKRRSAHIDEEVDGENYLAKVVYEDHELIDIGIKDQNGDPIMARKKMNPIGFIRFPR